MGSITYYNCKYPILTSCIAILLLPLTLNLSGQLLCLVYFVYVCVHSIILFVQLDSIKENLDIIFPAILESYTHMYIQNVILLCWLLLKLCIYIVAKWPLQNFFWIISGKVMHVSKNGLLFGKQSLSTMLCMGIDMEGKISVIFLRALDRYKMGLLYQRNKFHWLIIQHGSNIEQHQSTIVYTHEHSYSKWLDTSSK